MIKNYNKKILILSEISVCILLSLVLNYRFKILKFPSGGSITFELLPLFIFSFRNKLSYSFICCTLYSIIKICINFYVPPANDNLSILLCVALDYLIPFLAIALSNFFFKSMKNKLKNKLNFKDETIFIFSSILSLFIKFISHFFSGILIWKSYSQSYKDAILFSLIYNSVYCGIQTLILILPLKFLIQRMKKNG